MATRLGPGEMATRLAQAVGAANSEPHTAAPGTGPPAVTLSAGTLYVVATPIGHLDDITLRALHTLRAADSVAAENVRRTRSLLTHFGIATPVLSYREANRDAATRDVLARLQTGSVALVSDAGMPAISDPGTELVRAVVASGGRIEVVPGANAALMAVVASGLATAPFTFVGFLPRQHGDRLQQLASLADRPDTLVFYEAPHRVRATLRDLQETLGDRQAATCRELTKLHEEVRRGALSALSAHFDEVAPRGEFTLVVEGARPMAASADETATGEAAIDARLRAAMVAGDDMRAVIAALTAATRRPRRLLYARWQALREEQRADVSGDEGQ